MCCTNLLFAYSLIADVVEHLLIDCVIGEMCIFIFIFICKTDEHYVGLSVYCSMCAVSVGRDKPIQQYLGRDVSIPSRQVYV